MKTVCEQATQEPQLEGALLTGADVQSLCYALPDGSVEINGSSMAIRPLGLRPARSCVPSRRSCLTTRRR